MINMLIALILHSILMPFIAIGLVAVFVFCAAIKDKIKKVIKNDNTKTNK